ncbi:putative receptor-type tyrosine-protein phosphatase V-like [Penaeus vannamei]|uniref:Putative receptor-type tyrosine-protein phosphatase V-like n=1 Tax=Penaeus vannamei TaxID=6689 RepID=A0A423SD99_PENVA|nr:putative receptor-type tyrosine-protein phosphatase V-like [Penaeus vannamei]
MEILKKGLDAVRMSRGTYPASFIDVLRMMIENFAPPQPLEASCSSTPPAEHSIVVTWSAPNTFCNVSAYNVTYIGDVLWSDEEQVGTLQTSEEMANLSSLTSWTKYHVCVAGIVLDDFVGEQSCCDAVTQEAASGPPALFNVSGTSSSSISVFWEEPRAQNGKIDFYQLQFGGESVQVENATEFTLTGLAKNSKYIISLKFLGLQEATTCFNATGVTGRHASATQKAVEPAGTRRAERLLPASLMHGDPWSPEASVRVAARGRPRKDAEGKAKAANVGAIVASVLSGLLIVGVGVAAFIYRDKLRNVIARKTSKREPVQEHPLSTTSTAVGKDQLRSYIDGLQEDTQRGLEEEFARLKQQCPKPSTYDAEMDVNKPKNRFSNILAYDHSRVRISKREGAAQSDYINANFIKDHAGRPGFVATQGPTEDTLDDFWRLVWEQKVYTIVMLTSLMEKGKVSRPGEPGRPRCSSCSSWVVGYRGFCSSWVMGYRGVLFRSGGLFIPWGTGVFVHLGPGVLFILGHGVRGVLFILVMGYRRFCSSWVMGYGGFCSSGSWVQGFVHLGHGVQGFCSSWVMGYRGFVHPGSWGYRGFVHLGSWGTGGFCSSWVMGYGGFVHPGVGVMGVTGGMSSAGSWGTGGFVHPGHVHGVQGVLFILGHGVRGVLFILGHGVQGVLFILGHGVQGVLFMGSSSWVMVRGFCSSWVMGYRSFVHLVMGYGVFSILGHGVQGFCSSWVMGNGGFCSSWVMGTGFCSSWSWGTGVLFIWVMVRGVRGFVHLGHGVRGVFVHHGSWGTGGFVHPGHGVQGFVHPGSWGTGGFVHPGSWGTGGFVHLGSWGGVTWGKGVLVHPGSWGTGVLSSWVMGTGGFVHPGSWVQGVLFILGHGVRGFLFILGHGVQGVLFILVMGYGFCSSWSGVTGGFVHSWSWVRGFVHLGSWVQGFCSSWVMGYGGFCSSWVMGYGGF